MISSETELRFIRKRLNHLNESSNPFIATHVQCPMVCCVYFERCISAFWEYYSPIMDFKRKISAISKFNVWIGSVNGYKSRRLNKSSFSPIHRRIAFNWRASSDWLIAFIPMLYLCCTWREHIIANLRICCTFRINLFTFTNHKFQC